MRWSLGGRHVGERDREQRAADAIADRMHLALAGRLLDGVERRERALAHVVFEGLFRQMRSSGLTQEMTNTVRPWSTHHLMKDFSGVRSST